MFLALVMEYKRTDDAPISPLERWVSHRGKTDKSVNFACISLESASRPEISEFLGPDPEHFSGTVFARICWEIYLIYTNSNIILPGRSQALTSWDIRDPKSIIAALKSDITGIFCDNFSKQTICITTNCVSENLDYDGAQVQLKWSENSSK